MSGNQKKSSLDFGGFKKIDCLSSFWLRLLEFEVTINDTSTKLVLTAAIISMKNFYFMHNRLAYLLSLVVYENSGWLEWKQSINLVDLQFKSNESLKDLESDKISSEIRLTSLD